MLNKAGNKMDNIYLNQSDFISIVHKQKLQFVSEGCYRLYRYPLLLDLQIGWVKIKKKSLTGKNKKPQEDPQKKDGTDVQYMSLIQTTMWQKQRIIT